MGQVYFFLILLLVLLALCTWMVYSMVKTGKARAKGAKKRRAKVLPFLYRRPKHRRRKADKAARKALEELERKIENKSPDQQ